MIRINLLDYTKIDIIARFRTNVIIFLISLVVLIGILIGVQQYLDGKINDLKTKKENIEAELAKARIQLKKLQEMENKLNVLKDRLRVINELDQRRKEAFHLLDTLTKIVVENRMWLTSFQALEKVRTITKGKGKNVKKETKTDVEILIEGLALDEKTVADFMTRLAEAVNTDDIFKVTEACLNNFKEKKFPENIITGLEKLKDKEHENQEKFLEALKDVIGNEGVETYKSLILKCAGKDYFSDEILMYVRHELYGNIIMKRFQIKCINKPIKEEKPPEKQANKKGK